MFRRVIASARMPAALLLAFVVLKEGIRVPTPSAIVIENVLDDPSVVLPVDTKMQPATESSGSASVPTEPETAHEAP